MELFDLSRLSAGSFERLVRALSFDLMGPAGTVYSSGPDGARDFVFDGAIKGYEAKAWNGYLVLQAKFREKLRGGDEDIDWLRTNLALEADKFKQPNDNAIRKPEYYIIATNISLSGADGKAAGGRMRTGGYTKVASELDAWKIHIGLRDFDIWPADKIIDLLANAPKIRQTYASWVTSGDVLSYVLDSFQAIGPDFDAIVRRALKNSLRRDQYARLKDAGSVADAQIRTSQVFIDLPLTSAPLSGGDFLYEEQPRNSEPPGAVSRIIDRAKEKLDPETVAALEETSQFESGRSGNKIVLLGGPGQGKSTASTFVVQIFRAGLLEGDPSTKLDENVRLLVPEILERAEREGIARTVPRRYPVLISLPRYADEISTARSQGREPPSLLAQMASDLARASDHDVARGDVRNWLAHYPWIAVLDGLDEVPPSGERRPVIDAISSFLTEIAETRADVLLIVTTRPQGYNHDLDPLVWEHWRLADLPTPRALAYAKVLGDARYPDDPDRRDDILRSLKEAATKPATSRLMVSPLQVTILHMIVDTGGSVPTARWSLFNEYFEVLRKREKAKGGNTQKALERNWTLLGPIHHRAGLVLQTDSETAGGAGASMSYERFANLLRAYLDAEGYDEVEIEERVSELMDVALNRLVLLSTHQEGEIRFDVRSLQEFMAAAALTSDDAKTMEERLTHIAGIAHWRHVFLIAASRCFSEDGFHHRRASVAAIPRVLETCEPDMTVRNGARLALEMFLDGIGVDHPNSRRQLAQHAMGLLDLGPDAFDPRLPSLWENTTNSLIKAAICERIHQGNTDSAMAAWKLLINLAQDFPNILISIAEAEWPLDDISCCKLLPNIIVPLPSPKLVARGRETMLRIPVPELFGNANSFVTSLASYKPIDHMPDQEPLTSLNILNSQSQLPQTDISVLSSHSDAPLRLR